MKTKEQIFKSKIIEQVKELTNKGQHQKAKALFDEHFKLNYNYSKEITTLNFFGSSRNCF